MPEDMIPPAQSNDTPAPGAGTPPAPPAPAPGAGGASAAPPARGKAAPVPAGLTEDDVRRLLGKEIEVFKRGVGQTSQVQRRMQELEAEIKKLSAPKEASDYDSLSPEEKKQLRALVKGAWMEDFGREWGDYQKSYTAQMSQQKGNEIAGMVKQYLGDDFTEEMDKAVTEIYKSAREAAKNGDPTAENFMREVWETKSGVLMLAELGRRYVAQQTADKAVAAGAVQNAKLAKTASPGTAPGPRPQPQPTGKDAILAKIKADTGGNEPTPEQRKQRIELLKQQIPHEADR